MRCFGLTICDEEEVWLELYCLELCELITPLGLGKFLFRLALGLITCLLTKPHYNLEKPLWFLHLYFQYVFGWMHNLVYCLQDCGGVFFIPHLCVFFIYRWIFARCDSWLSLFCFRMFCMIFVLRICFVYMLLL